MKNRVFFISTLFLIINIYACQYPVTSTDLPDPERFIVIDAELTQAYGRVRVNYTLTEVNSNGAYLLPTPPKATAYVVDSKGNRWDFKIDGSRDTTFKGVVGETYKLYVSADGQQYESDEETMRACPDINSLSAVYAREPNRDANDLLYDGYDIYAELNDMPNQQDYYQWDWIHYERTNSCDRIKEGDNFVLVPCASDCWTIKYNTRVIVQSDKLRDGNPIAQRITRIPYATPPQKYYLRVEQRAITPRVFDYMKSLEIQTQNVGSLFDIPAQTRFSPNIYNVNAPKEQIIGVFNVFSFQRKIIYVDMSKEIPGVKRKFIGDVTPFTSMPLLTAPCIEGLYRTRIKPDGWID